MPSLRAKCDKVSVYPQVVRTLSGKKCVLGDESEPFDLLCVAQAFGEGDHGRRATFIPSDEAAF